MLAETATAYLSYLDKHSMVCAEVVEERNEKHA